VLLWFRNDLRTHDNPAFHYFLNHGFSKEYDKAVFFVSKKQWLKHHWSEIKIDFIMRHAYHLSSELEKLGITLDIISVDTFEQQALYIKQYCIENNISQVVANAELEYNEQKKRQLNY
jgi:deoxyribodipyrimidine photo-lyase